MPVPGNLMTHSTVALGVAERDTIVNVTADADYTVRLQDRFVRCSGTGSNTSTITLPPVALASGMVVSISANIASTAAITVAHAGDSENWTNLTLDTDEDRATLMSNGNEWVVLENAIA